VAFLTYDAFAKNAIAAVTPAGYVRAYQNLHTTYDEPSQFVRYMQMDTYDVQQCKCLSHLPCSSHIPWQSSARVTASNLLSVMLTATRRQRLQQPRQVQRLHRLLRAPPHHGARPISTTQIKCDLWAGTILPTMPLNTGQMRHDFNVVMAGSNAYVKGTH
jgi:hypothetical protein